MLTLYDLQLRLLYAIIVAGKSAKFAEQAFSRFMPVHDPNILPFQVVRSYVESGALMDRLKEARVGNYTKIERAFRELTEADLDLAVCTPEDLEKIHGIGPKTARFFVLWTRPEARYAVLDVHVLRWLRTQGIQTPTQTPSGSKYAMLERQYLEIVDRLGLTPRQVDEQVWMQGSGYGQYNPAL